MKKICIKRQISGSILLPKEVIDVVYETITILDENYGKDRKLESDLGGYILIAESIVDIGILKQDRLQGLIPEYTDVIECSDNRRTF